MVAYGTEKPQAYRPRLVDERLQRLLSTFGAVEIRGTKWCGKSWAALVFGESVVHLDDPNVKALAEADPALALQGARPHVVDEWQEAPSTWDATRRAVDAAGGERGLFILTGSSTPAKDAVTHSGAGRIARVDMSTMTLWERGLSTGSVSLSGLFESAFDPSACETSLAPLADAICCGGWPALVGADAQTAAEVIDQYLDAMFEVSVPKKGGTPDMARRIVSSLARNVATAATLQTIAQDASLGDEAGAPAASTVTSYLNMLEDMYVIEGLHGWDAPVRAKSRLRTKPNATSPTRPSRPPRSAWGRRGCSPTGRPSASSSSRCASTTCGLIPRACRAPTPDRFATTAIRTGWRSTSSSSFATAAGQRWRSSSARPRCPTASGTSSACAKRSPPTRRPATPSPSFALLSPRRLPSAATTPPMMSTFFLSPLCGSKRSRRPECKQGRRCVRCDAAGCARVDVGGCRGFACGCPPCSCTIAIVHRGGMRA